MPQSAATSIRMVPPVSPRLHETESPTFLKARETADKPWMSEPDRKEWSAQGFRCVVIRQRPHGHLCGYVAVPSTHPLYGVLAGQLFADPGDIDKLMDLKACAILRATSGMTQKERASVLAYIKFAKATHEEQSLVAATVDEGGQAAPTASTTIHGGLTYAKNRLPGYVGEGLWWFGFHCGHLGDLCPSAPEDPRVAAGHVYRPHDHDEPGPGRAAAYCDMAYVTEQTERLAGLLAAVAGGQGCVAVCVPDSERKAVRG